jgi:hypothetical protein
MAAPTPSNLHLASNVAITTALSNLRSTYNARNAWQNTTTNKYVLDTIEELGRDILASSINNTDAVHYLASSVFIHCFNGWNYLSNAINSMMEGDYGSAIHNAYYAELRSIFSILASQGIGVFNKKNILVDQNGIVHRVTPFNSPTHTFAKEAFDEWLNNPANSETILKLFTVGNAPLKDWIECTGISSALSGELASTKMKQWSLDLNIVNEEQKFRNFVSYNPLKFDLSTATLADNIENRLKFLIDLWKLCGPSDLFTLSILRNSYESLYTNTYNVDIKDLDMKADWERLFTDLGQNVNDSKNQRIIQFLRRDINTVENSVFNYADNVRHSTPILEGDVDPFGIISRACLLLLINTKIVESILRQSGTSKVDLKFWFDNIGLKSGFWGAAGEPQSFSDLWSDVEIEIEDIENWINNPHTIFDAFNYKNDLKESTMHIRNFGKAYLWNTGL